MCMTGQRNERDKSNKSTGQRVKRAAKLLMRESSNSPGGTRDAIVQVADSMMRDTTPGRDVMGRTIVFLLEELRQIRVENRTLSKTNELLSAGLAKNLAPERAVSSRVVPEQVLSQQEEDKADAEYARRIRSLLNLPETGRAVTDGTGRRTFVLGQHGDKGGDR